MNKYSRFLSFAAVLLCLTPLGGVYTLFQTFPWTNGGSGNQLHNNIHVESSSSFQPLGASHDGTCAAAAPYRFMMDGSHQDSFPDPIRFDADSFLNASIDTSYRTGTNTTRHQPTRASASHHAYQQQRSRSLHRRQQQSELDPLIFHVRNNEFYNHFDHRNNHVLLLSWTISLLLGLLVPVLALLYDAYLRITSKSRHQKQLQAIQKAIKPYKHKVLTKSQAKETCPICLSQFAMGESILKCGRSDAGALGGCSHRFHQSCMVQWLLQQTKQQPNQLVETILSNEPAMSTLRSQRKAKLEAPCPCCRQPFVKVPLVR